MAKKKLTPLATAVGATMVATLAAMPISNASSNPFSMTDLGSGYKVAAQGECGGKKADKKEGQCGGKKADKKEGQCGEGKCGGKKDDKKDDKKEGKCGGKK